MTPGRVDKVPSVPRAAARPTIVCLHGLGRSPADWAPVRDALGECGPVIAADLTQPDALERAIREAGGGSVLIGHSWGAVTAMRIATEGAPHIRALVLTGSFFPPSRNGRSAVAALGDYGRHRLAFARDALDRRRSRSTGSRPAGPGLGRLLATAANRRAFDATARSVRAPALVVHALDDHYVPLGFAEAAARRYGWTLATLQGGGHYPHRDTPTEWLGAVLPWLAEQDVPERANRLE